jgi:hypothetical protein
MTEMTPAEREKQYRELAATIADQAQAIADGTLTGPRFGMVQLIKRNAETLAAWTPDDRSGMPDPQLDEVAGPEPGIRDHVRVWHPLIGAAGLTDAELSRRHGSKHFQQGSTTHHHGPDAGAHGIPRGWRDGSGVVPIDHRSAMQRKPPAAPEQEAR